MELKLLENTNETLCRDLLIRFTVSQLRMNEGLVLTNYNCGALVSKEK